MPRNTSALIALPAAFLTSAQVPSLSASCERMGAWSEGEADVMNYKVRIGAREGTQRDSWKATVDGDEFDLSGSLKAWWNVRHGGRTFEDDDPNDAGLRFEQPFTTAHESYALPIDCMVIFDVKKGAAAGMFEPTGRFVDANCAVPSEIPFEAGCDREFEPVKKRLAVGGTIKPVS